MPCKCPSMILTDLNLDGLNEKRRGRKEEGALWSTHNYHSGGMKRLRKQEMITSEINRGKGLSGVMEAEGADGSVWGECFTWVGDTN